MTKRLYTNILVSCDKIESEPAYSVDPSLEVMLHGVDILGLIRELREMAAELNPPSKESE